MDEKQFEEKLIEMGFSGETAGLNIRRAMVKIQEAGGIKSLRGVINKIDKRDIPEFLIKSVGVDNVVIVGLIANSDLDF